MTCALKASSWSRWAARPTSGTSWTCSARAGSASGWPACATRGRSAFVCVADLEDELIRALGTGRVEDLIEAEGESGPFLTFTRQPAHRDTARDRQLRRFMGTRSGRKIRYGHLLAAALDLTVIPAPLASLLSAV